MSKERGHQDVQRRTWNKDDYEARAREREATERAGKKYKTQAELDQEEARQKRVVTVVNDATSRPDMEAYDFKALVGQRRIVTAENALSEQGGFYCEPCDYLLKDQKSYLEHCNKPQHLAKMGLPSEVRRATVDDIRERLAALKKSEKKTEKKKPAPVVVVAKKPEEPEKKKKEKSAKDQIESKKRKPNDVEVEEEQLEFDPSAFGLPSSFGSTKKS
jgi:U4/U6.U5 tri-snRNP component SNU23